MNKWKWSIELCVFVLLMGCNPVEQDLSRIEYAPELLVLEVPPDWPSMPIPSDNPLTQEGVALGRMLFYDPILSLDSTQSCASCHLQSLAFTDAQAQSKGVLGLKGQRSAPSLANVGYYYQGLFWDGRVRDLETQSLHPVRDKKELASNWSLVLDRIQEHPQYPIAFRKAFNIKQREAIDSLMMAKALAQFQRTLLSFNAKFDQMNRGELEFTEAERRGWAMFFDAKEELPHAECSHCHTDPLFTNLEYQNNGIQELSAAGNYRDPGKALASGNPFDSGKFKVPTLRNIALTAPYMHRGQLSNLDEVLEHYISGGHYGENVSANVRKLALSERDKNDLITFLYTLTDSSFIENPNFGNPFKNAE